MRKLSLKKITKKLSENPKAQLSIDLFFLGLSITSAVGYANEGKSVFVGLLCFFAGLIGFSINVNLEKIIKKEGEKDA